MKKLDFRPLSDTEREDLFKALRQNALGKSALKMADDTTFAGTSFEISDDEVISAIKNCPTHY